MAARTPRRSFATPFVVTLAAAPACYVQTTSAPQPPPQQIVEEGPPPPPVNQPSGTQTSPPPPPASQPPVVIANPPPPATQPAPPPTTQPAPRPRDTNQVPTQTGVVVAGQGPKMLSESRWTVFKAKGGGCMAAIKVECQPQATCNPPPPFKYTCPDNVSLDKPVTVVSHDGVKCFVEFEMPSCPEGVACNPPRPRPVACPSR